MLKVIGVDISPSMIKKAREIVIDIPAGKHMIEIYPLDEDKNTLLGKLLFPKKDVKLKE